METILVTGGDGFLGSQVVSGLLKLNYNVIVLEKKKDKFSRLSSFIHKIKIIYNEHSSIENIFKEFQISSIVHCATNYGRFGNLSEIIYDNVLLPITLLELGISNGLKNFFNTDTYFNSANHISYEYLNTYVTSKKHLVDWLIQSKNSAKIFNMKLEHIYGPNDNPEKFVTSIINKLLSEEKIISLTKGEQRRDFIYIDDAVSSFIFILKNIDRLPNGYNLISVGTSASLSISDFVLLAKQISKSTSYLDFGIIPYRVHEIMDSYAQDSILQKMGWKAQTKLQEGLTNCIEFEKMKLSKL